MNYNGRVVLLEGILSSLTPEHALEPEGSRHPWVNTTLLSSFLSNRLARVRLNDSLSSPRPMCQGLKAQFLLCSFLCYINSLPEVVPRAAA